MRRLHRSLLVFVILVLSGGPLVSLPSRSSADPGTLQAIQLVYPLRNRYKINALYDHTNPTGGNNPDNQIQIYTGRSVRNDAEPNDQCSDSGWWGYTDWDMNLGDLRWDQDNPGACPDGGPGWLWYDSHEGYDLGCLMGTTVSAARQGTAQHVGSTDLRIDHGAGYFTYYRHLQSRIPHNTPVHTGQQIGESGTGGTGPHLHFEVQLNGNYVDPYGWEQGNLWAGGEPFPMGYVDQNNAAHGPFQLNNSKIRNKWISLASQLGSPVANVCELAGNCPPPWPGTPTCSGQAGENTLQLNMVQRFERGYIYYCNNGSAIARYYNNPDLNLRYYQAFLPRVLASENASDWNSYIYVRNLGGAATTASITFYTNDGRVLDSRVYDGLPGNATWQVDVRAVLLGQFLSRVDYDPIYSGSAIVASDRDVAVVVVHGKSNRLTAYTGVSSLNAGTGWGLPASTLYVPTVMWNAWSSQWKSYLHVQNTSPDPAAVTVRYCWQNNPDSCFNDTGPTTLPAYGSAVYDLQSEIGGGSFWGSARVTADRDLAVVVFQDEPTYGTADFNAFANGATTTYLPSLMRSWYNWTSSFTVQNLGGAATNVQIHYVDENGNVTDRTYPNLAAGSSVVIVQNDPAYGVPYEGWHGTATLSAGQPIVAIVNQQLVDFPPGSGYNSVESYSGFVAGGGTLYGPLAAYRGQLGSYYLDSCSDVQNVGGADATISTLNGYYRAVGSPITNAGSSVWTGPGRVAMFYVPREPNVPSGFYGSVKVTCTASAAAGIHNIARLRDQQGNPTSGDFGASYNMIQR